MSYRQDKMRYLPQYKQRPHGETGREFEDLIEATATLYWLRKKAWIKKEEVKTTKIQGKGLIFSQKAPYDYHGSIFRDGGAQSVYFEAKSTEKPELRVLKPNVNNVKQGGGVMAHQLLALLDLEKAGAEAFVLWRESQKFVFKISPSFLYYSIGLGGTVRETDIPKLQPIPVREGFFDYLNLL